MPLGLVAPLGLAGPFGTPLIALVPAPAEPAGGGDVVAVPLVCGADIPPLELGDVLGPVVCAAAAPAKAASARVVVTTRMFVFDILKISR